MQSGDRDAGGIKSSNQCADGCTGQKVNSNLELFQSWVEWWNRATPEENLQGYADGVLEAQLGYEGKLSDLFPDAAAFVADLERWWNLYQGMGLAKRIQAPPILGIKRRVFGFDHRESQMGPRYTRAYMALKADILQHA